MLATNKPPLYVWDKDEWIEETDFKTFKENMPQFVNPIAPKDSVKKPKTPWSFRQPEYDERSSCYMDAGTHYGVGYTNPVGHTGPVKQRVSTMPFGHKLGMESDEAPRRLLNPDLIE